MGRISLLDMEGDQ